MAATVPVLLVEVLTSLLALFVAVEAIHICDEHCLPPGFLCNPAGCLQPQDPFVFIGSNLTLNCTLRSENRSSDLCFEWQNDKEIPSEYQRVISPYDLQLNMPVGMDDPNTFTVMCRDNTTPGALPWSQRVNIDYAPETSNFQVIVNDWGNVTITWETPTYRQTTADVTTNVTWTAHSATSWYYCDNHNGTYCFLDNYKDSNNYNISINISYSFASKERATIQKYFFFYSAAHVKPSPVTSLVDANTTSRSLVLRWQHGKDKRALMFRVTGTRGNDEIFNEMTENNTTVVTELLPFTKYHFVVRTKSVGGGYWSEPSSISVTTSQDKPDRGPRMEPAAYYDQCEANTRKVLIYLKPPAKEDRNGVLTYYSLTYAPSDGSPSFTRTPAADVIHYIAYLKCDVDYNVSVSVNTSIGASPASYLYIPKYGSVSGPLSVKVGRINTTLGRVHWEAAPQTTPLYWIVFWCTGSSKSFISEIAESCQDAVNWTRVVGSQRSLDIDKDLDGFVIYGVSMATETGSSGIRWNDCVYDAKKAPTGKPKIGAVESQPDLSLTVKWRLETCEDNTLITHYVIQCCRPPDSLTCVTNSISSDHSEYVIPGLQEGVTYSVSLQQVAVSKKKGMFSDPVTGVPIHKALKAGQILGIVVGSVAVFVLTLVVVILCFRYSCRKCKEKDVIVMPRHIDDPVFSSNEKYYSLSDGQNQLEILQTQTQTKGCVRQVSVDSGRGSLSSVTADTLTSPGQSPDPTSPNGQFKPVFDPVEEEGSLSESGSKRNSLRISKQTIQLPLNYAVIALEDKSVFHVNVSSAEDQTVDTKQEEDGGFSGFSNDGFDDEADSVPPYVTAGQEDGDCAPAVCNSGSSGKPADEGDKGLNLGFCGDEKIDAPGGQDLKGMDAESLKCLTDSDVPGRDVICQKVSSSLLSANGSPDQSLCLQDDTTNNSQNQSSSEGIAGYSCEKHTSRAADDMTLSEGSGGTEVTVDIQRSRSVSPEDEGLGSLQSDSGSGSGSGSDSVVSDSQTDSGPGSV